MEQRYSLEVLMQKHRQMNRQLAAIAKEEKSNRKYIAMALTFEAICLLEDLLLEYVPVSFLKSIL